MSCLRWCLPLSTTVLVFACSDEPVSAPEDAGTSADAAVDAAEDATPMDASDAAPKRFSVSGGFIRDADGRSVVLAGVNLANAHKQSPYLGFHQAADFSRIKDEWGFNAVRFLILWAAIEPQKGVYDDAYLDQVAQRMDWAASAGLLVVLDMHQDLYGEGFGGDGAPRWTCDESHYAAFVPTTPWFLNYANPHVTACFDGFWNSDELKQHYRDAWAKVASKLGKHPAVIGFDIMNEPYWGSFATTSFENEVLSPFYEGVVTAVRAQAPDWLAFIEPSASKNLGIPTSLSTPAFDGVVYAPHAYDSSAEQGNGFNPAGRGALMARIQGLRNEADALNAALFVGEFGGQASQPGITEYMDAEYDGMAAALSAGTYWSYDRDGGYGMLNADGSEKTNLLDVLVRPYPARVAGTPTSWSFDEATSTFSVSWTVDPAITAPTEIVVPARVYSAPQVDCSGCIYELRGDRLIVTQPPSGDPATLGVHP